MKRYLLRALVAVLTFSIGVAIGSLFSRPRVKPSFNCKNFEHQKQFRYKRHGYHQKSWAGPYISVDTLTTDPLKLEYSSTTPIAGNSNRQTVELRATNNTKKEIASFEVSYTSRWASNRRGGGGGVFVDATKLNGYIPSNGVESVSIECDFDQSLNIWISSVEFKDGSRWTNSRLSGTSSVTTN